MATEVALQHKDTGHAAKGYNGFSWTTAFFGPFPALFRSDYVTFLVYAGVVAVVILATGGIGLLIALGAQIVWAFAYNAHHLQGLVSKGYGLGGKDVTNIEAQKAAGVSAAAIGLRPEPPELTNDAYKIYLVRKYKIERNEALQKVIVRDRLFASVDDGLAFADQEEKSFMPQLLPSSLVEQWKKDRKVVHTTLSQGLKIYWLDNGTVAVDGFDDTFPTVNDARVRSMSGF